MGLLQVSPEEAVDPVEALVRRAHGGDPVAFARLVARYERDAVATAIGLLRNREAAEEAVQESFCRAWEALGSLRLPSKFKVWFTSILYRVCRDAQRARGRDRRAAPVLRRASQRATGADGSAAPVVEEALELPDEYREPLVLFYLQELSVSELAEALGITEENAKVRLHRARKLLRERLERKGLGRPPGGMG